MGRLAEEEVLIRDDSGLLLDVGETRVPKSQEWTKKLTKTICLSLGFLVLGLCVAIPGPTLLDLEDQVKATTFEMMIVFASRSMGYLLGALLGGVLFDCFDKQLLLFCTLLVSSIATVAIPWSLTLVVMATMFALQGVTMGALDTGGNVFCIQLWGKKNPPFMQTLHFAFGIGAFIAPLLAKPFLSDVSVAYNTTSIVQGNIPVAPFVYEELHHNRTRRSQIFAYPDFRQVNYDFVNTLAVRDKAENDRRRSENNIYKRSKFEDVYGRWKRQSGGDGDNTGMWKWKRQQSKRDVTPNEPDPGTPPTLKPDPGTPPTLKPDPGTPTTLKPDPGTTTTLKPGTPTTLKPDPGTPTTLKPDDFKTNKTQLTSDTDESEEKGQLDADGNSMSSEKEDTNNDVKATEKGGVNDNKNKIMSGGLAPDNSESDTNLQSSTTNKTEVVLPNMSNSSKINSDITKPENGTKISTNHSAEATVITTIGTSNPTTTEEKVHKPSAATDKNRKPGTADGKDISKHLNDHKNEIPPDTSTGDADEENAENVKEKVEEVNTPDLNKDKLNVSVASVNSTLTGDNNTSVNITQFSSESGEHKSTPAAGIKLPTTNSSVTVKPKNSTLAEASQNAATIPTVKTTRPSTKLTTIFTTTKKPTTTTSPPPPTTTTTATPTTTTAKATTTTTTTTVKTTTTTTTTPTTTLKTTTRELLTSKPVTKAKISAQSTKKLELTSSKPNEVTEKPSVIQTSTSNISVTNSTVTVVSVPNTTLSDDKLSTTEVSLKPESAVDSFLNNAIHAVKNISKIQFAYLITGLALFLIAVIFLVLYCKDKRRLTTDRDLDELERFKSGITCTKTTLIFLLGLFFFCYMGLEVTFGALVTTFAVDFNKWSKEQGAMAAAIFWGSLATGRGLSIFLSRCCGPTIMLVFDLIFMVIGGLVLSIGIHFYDKMLWLGTLILGLGMSSAFPAGISWAEKYFHLTGKSTAVFVIGSAVGQMIIPVVMGYLYEYLGPIVLMYASLILSIIALVIFILMQCVAINKKATLNVHERNGFLPLEDDDDAEENLEMDDFVHFDKSQTRMRRDKRGGGSAEYHTLISDLEDD